MFHIILNTDIVYRLCASPCGGRLLESCPYSHATFADILNKIQKAIDDLSLHQYSNLGTWVGRLDEAIEQRLAGRSAAVTGESGGGGGQRGHLEVG